MHNEKRLQSNKFKGHRRNEGMKKNRKYLQRALSVEMALKKKCREWILRKTPHPTDFV